jgi:ubiquinone biosynthesis protein
VIGNQIRNIKRWKQIVQVLARYGFVEFLREIGLGDVVASVLERVRFGRGEAELMRMPTPVRLRKAMEELGPTFIKLGQVLSTRRDLVPDEWATEFAKLQSGCPSVPFSDIEGQLDEAFPDGAVLLDGTTVVLKILRPKIREMIIGDMEALRFLANLVDEHIPNVGFDPKATVEEFAKELDRETDLTNEGRATERLTTMFADDPEVDFPTIHWHATTRDVLCESLATGTLLADLDVSSLTDEQRRSIVTIGAGAVFHQTLEVGFFHADPHPGNIFIRPDGGLTFIDCGMTGFVDDQTRLRLAEIVYGITRNDADMVMRAAISLADVDLDKVDIKAARADVQQLVGRFVGVPLDRIDMGGVLDEFFQTLRRHDLRCPADVVLLIKALTTIEGVAMQIDPTFDLISFTRPYIEKLLKGRFSPKALARRFREAGMEILHLGETLPGELSSFLQRARRNRLRLQLDIVAIEDLVVGLEDASERIGYALLISALVMASAILVLASRGTGIAFHLGVAGFVVSATFAFGLMFNGWRNRRKLKKRTRALRRARGERD